MSSSTILVNLIPNIIGTPTDSVQANTYKGTLIVPVKAKISPLINAKLYVVESEEEIKATEGTNLEPGIYNIIVDSKYHTDYYPVKITFENDPYPTSLNQILINLYAVGFDPIGISENSGESRKNFFTCLKKAISQIPIPPKVEFDNREILERLATLQSIVKDLAEDRKKPTPSHSEEIYTLVKRALKEENLSDTVDSLRKTLRSDEILECLRKVPSVDSLVIATEVGKIVSQEQKNISHAPLLTEIRNIRSAEIEKLQKETELLKQKLLELEKEKNVLYQSLQEAEDYITSTQQLQ